MNVTVFKKIEAIIAIPFVEDEITTNSVCFACSDELRADFRIQFIVQDVVNYVYGIISKLYWKENEVLESIADVEIPYPSNATFFWNQSSLGEKFLQNNIIKEIEFIDVTDLNWIQND